MRPIPIVIGKRDGSARGVVPPTNVFYQMKSRDTFAPA
jgi:hypothetical protein